MALEKIWKYLARSNDNHGERCLFRQFCHCVGISTVFLRQGLQWFLLIVYTFTIADFFMTLKTFLCSQCIFLGKILMLPKHGALTANTIKTEGIYENR